MNIKFEKSNNLFDNKKASTGKINGHTATRIHYEDLSSLKYPSNSDVAEYLNRARYWMMQGVEVRFMNAPEPFRQKLKSLGLEDVFKIEG